jgi:hypothetical protein
VTDFPSDPPVEQSGLSDKPLPAEERIRVAVETAIAGIEQARESAKTARGLVNQACDAAFRVHDEDTWPPIDKIADKIEDAEGALEDVLEALEEVETKRLRRLAEAVAAEFGAKYGVDEDDVDEGEDDGGES